MDMKYLAMVVCAVIVYLVIKLQGAQAWQASAFQIMFMSGWIAVDNILDKLEELKK